MTGNRIAVYVTLIFLYQNTCTSAFLVAYIYTSRHTIQLFVQAVYSSIYTICINSTKQFLNWYNFKKVFTQSKSYLFLLIFTCFKQVIMAQHFYTAYQSFTKKEGYEVYEMQGAITQDDKGLLWIGSDNGLIAFDGVHFNYYRNKAGDSNGIPSNTINYNFQDKNGNYWVSAPGYGTYSFDFNTQSFKKLRYKNQQDFNIHQYNAGLPLETTTGEFWIPLRNFGLAKWNRQLHTMKPYRLQGDSNGNEYYQISWINAMAEDPADGTLWLATNNGLVHFFSASGQYQVYKDSESLVGQVVNHLLFDRQQRLWVGAWGAGIKYFNKETKKFTSHKWFDVNAGTKNICSGIGIMDDEHLWVSALDHSLMLFSTKTYSFSTVAGLDDAGVAMGASSLFQNNKAVLWLVSPRALTRINSGENKFVYHPLQDSTLLTFANHGFYSFVKTNASLLIGVYYGGSILQYDINKKKFFPLKSATVRNVLFLSEDKKGDVWIASTHGLMIYDTAAKKIKNKFTAVIKKKLDELTINAVLHADDSTTWLAARQGLLRLDYARDKLEWVIKVNAAKTEAWLNVLYKDHLGNTWFGTNANGIGCYQRRTGTVVYFNQQRNPLYPKAVCTSIAETPEGDIVFNNGNAGLCVLSHPFKAKEKIMAYNTSNGFISDRITAVFKDKQSRFWLFTNKGLCYLNLADMSTTCFSEQEGLYQNLIYSYPYVDDKGLIYLGHSKSFQVVDPSALLDTAGEAGSIYLSSFKVNGHEITEQPASLQTITLPYNQTNISFDFAFLSAAQTPGYQYAYQLEGLDKTWRHTGSNAAGQFSNLAPGSYQLHIKAFNKNGSWSSKAFTLHILITPAWYKSWWFYTLFLICSLAMVVFIFRYRVSQIRKENNLKTQFNKKLNEIEMRALRAQMNPHFIFNCLNSINRYIVKSDHKTASSYLTKFSKLIRLILDNSASDSISLERELETLQLYIEMENLRFDNAFDYFIETGANVQPDTIAIPSMLLQPYIENAIWHGLLHKDDGKGMLTIKITRPEENLLYVQIDDNGVGRKRSKEIRSAETIRRSYGIQISKERIQLINNLYNVNASVSIEDIMTFDKVAGTRVVLKIPIKTEPADAGG